MEKATWQDILDLARDQGVITPAEVKALGLAPENLNRLVQQGMLVRSGRGIYEHPDFEITEMHSYVEVAKAIPEGVFCLLSALRIHDIGTQNPHKVWIAVPRQKRIPRARSAQIRVVRMSPLQFDTEIEPHKIEGITLRVYSLEKTIIDCLRLRHLVGHDVGVEALKEAMKQQKVSVSKLMDVAKCLKSTGIVSPYVEALLQ